MQHAAFGMIHEWLSGACIQYMQMEKYAVFAIRQYYKW